MRASTGSLLVQLDHLWSLRRTIRQIAAGSVLESADQLSSHLDGIRTATDDCPTITNAAGKARDHCLRFILRCHQGDLSDDLRYEALRSIDELEDEILRYKVVDEDAPVLAARVVEKRTPELRLSASSDVALERAYFLRGAPTIQIHERAYCDGARASAAMA